MIVKEPIKTAAVLRYMVGIGIGVEVSTLLRKTSVSLFFCGLLQIGRIMSFKKHDDDDEPLPHFFNLPQIHIFFLPFVNLIYLIYLGFWMRKKR